MTSRSAAMLVSACFFVTCIGIASGCGFPGTPAHSSVTFSTTQMKVGTEASYSCERGFELLGPSKRVCQANGTWAPAGIPFCVINVAAGKAPMQSTTHQDGIPQKAVDGSTSGLFSPQTCTLTQPERSPLWYVNLLEPFMIQLVRIDFGRPCCDHNVPANIVVRVGNNRPDLLTNPICNRYTGVVEEGRPLFLPCNPPMPGAFVSVHLEGPGQKRLSICETFVYTDQALPVERCPQFREQPLGATATYNGRCYTFYNQQPRSFGRAQEFCAERAGTLIAETSPALQGFLSWELWRRHRSEPDGQYWLGAVRDPHRPAVWSWLTGQQVTVSFWSLPGSGGDCARLDATKDWLWSATDCYRRINFVCQHEPLTCGRPEQPPDSTLTAAEYGVGARIVYRCEPGHLLVGPEERECLPTGFYSGYPPTCKRLECGLPADIANGSYRFRNGSRAYLSTVEYSCDPGYTLIGRPELICDVDERWNGPPPRCQAVGCGTPPAILNGAYRSLTNDTAVGALLEYYCLDDRFTLIGAKVLRCDGDGQYDQQPPVCRAPDATSTAAGVTVDFSFLDEALAASASEVAEQQTIDLGDLSTLWGTGTSEGDREGTEGDREGTEDSVRTGGDSTGADEDPTETESEHSKTDGSNAETLGVGTETEVERQESTEFESETAAVRLAAATDLSFAYQPTEGSPAFDLSIRYRPLGEGSSTAAPSPPDPHRRGRPSPTRSSLFPGQWRPDGAVTTPSPDQLADELNWSERTTAPVPPVWSGDPPRLTVSLTDLPSHGTSGAVRPQPEYHRNRSDPGPVVRGRPAPVVTPGGFFEVVPPAQFERPRVEPAPPPGEVTFPGHRRRYRPVVRRTRLPALADEGSYGIRRRFRPISLKDVAPEYSVADRTSATRESNRPEGVEVTPESPVERAPSDGRWRLATSTERTSGVTSGHLPPIDFTLMPPSFWPDLHSAPSARPAPDTATLPPFSSSRLRPPPASSPENLAGSPDYELSELIEPTEPVVPPTEAWEPARTSASPAPRSDLMLPPAPAPSGTAPLAPAWERPKAPPPAPAREPSEAPPPAPVRESPETRPSPSEPSKAPPAAAAEPASTAAPGAAVPENAATQQPAGYDRAEESQEPDTVNIRQDARPGVRIPDVGEDRTDPRDATAPPRLNLSGIIALGVFGGFVFLTAVLTSIVIIVRKTQRRTRHRSGARRHHYISSSYSTDSDSRGLSRHSRRGAWSGGRPSGRPPGQSPHSQGYRDSAEVTVADVAHMFRGGDKRRHHHHHHHRHHHGDERSRRH